MIVTEVQYRCLRAVCNTRQGVYVQEKRFRLQTVAALLSRGLVDIDMSKTNEGEIIQTKFTRTVYNLNKHIHLSGITYKQALKRLHINIDKENKDK